MSLKICISAHTLDYPQGGGHFWVHLNWALGLRALGCQVLWLEKVGIDEKTPVSKVLTCMERLKSNLAHYGMPNGLVLCPATAEPLPGEIMRHCLSVDAAADSELLLNFRYDEDPVVTSHFRRTALIDIDPGLLQLYLAQGVMKLTPHDLYFTIGETVGRPDAGFPDCGLPWLYTRPCVSLDSWPVHRAGPGAAFTTVSHWCNGEWVADEKGGSYNNEKRTAFLPYLDLPARANLPLELALCLEGDQEERSLLEGRGWRVKEAWEVSGSPQQYQRYVQDSRGEFSCVKEHCVRMQNAWVSDRTLCYLASGKPAIVQHTGPSSFLPDAEGLFRFRDLDEAARCLQQADAEYDRQCRAARALAEEYFDARKVVQSVLERALD